MNNLFSASMQPATHYIDQHIQPAMHFRNNPRTLIRCWRCRKLRWAKKLQVQVFFDSVRFWCIDKYCYKK